jgi:hypothetical protein
VWRLPARRGNRLFADGEPQYDAPSQDGTLGLRPLALEEVYWGCCVADGRPAGAVGKDVVGGRAA